MQGVVASDESSSTQAYADIVADNVLKRNPKKRHWVGNLLTAIWAVNVFLWDTAWASAAAKMRPGRDRANNGTQDWILPGSFGLNALAKKREAGSHWAVEVSSTGEFWRPESFNSAIP